MQQSPLHTTRQLSPAVRGALESLLGRALKDSEAISVRTYEAHDAPTAEAQEAALRGLKRHFAKVDKQLAGVPAAEHEEAVEEAIRSARLAGRPR